MRKIAGWVCFISFVSALGFAGYFCYVTLAPFFRGGEVRGYWDDKRWAEDLPQQLAANGLNRSDSALLRGDALHGSPYGSYRSWDTLFELVDTWTTPKFTSLATDKVWAGVADANGKVVATYPEDLLWTMGRVEKPTIEGWRGAIGSRRSSDTVKAGLIHDAHGKQIGSFAMAWAPYRYVAVIPPEAEVHGWVSQFSAALVALVSLLVFAIMLPIWVAMDADWRGMRGGAWAVLVVVTGAIGFAAYLIARLAPPRQCPNCGEMVHSGYKRCPACGVSLLTRCPKCGRRLKPGWQFCPRCTSEQPQEPQQPERPEPTPQPEPITIQPQPSPLLAKEGPGEVVPALPTLSHSTLAVTVLNAATSAPVSEAAVSISGPTNREGQTSSTGRFDARSLVTGPYNVSASAKGYRAAQASVKLDPDAITPLQLTLEPLAGAIDGRVLDRAALQPVPGARVFIDSARLERSTNADADGFFALADIPAGPYTVRADAAGFASQTRLAEVEPGQRVTIGFALEAETTEQEKADAVE